MRGWLKFFFGSFFSHSLADEAGDRKFWNCVLSFVLFVLILWLSLSVGYYAVLPYHLNRSSDFRAFITNAVENCGLTLEVKNGCISVNDGRVIDTYVNDDDEEFRYKGYNLIVDTRNNENSYNDFNAYCKEQKGDKTISYEEYLSLTDADKKNYLFVLEYTERSLEITDKLVDKCETYLNSLDSGSIYEQYKALDKSSMDKEDYANGVYELYVQGYYPDLSSREKFGKAPTMRTYYIGEYLAFTESGADKYEDYLIILDKMVMVSFRTDSGLRFSAAGYIGNDTVSVANGGQTVNFIKSFFRSQWNVIFQTYSIYLLTQGIPVFLMVWFVAAVLMSVTAWILKHEEKRFGYMLKISGSFIFMSTVIASVVCAILNFFVARVYVFYTGLIITVGLLALRSAVWIIMEAVRIRRLKKSEQTETDENP